MTRDERDPSMPYAEPTMDALRRELAARLGADPTQVRSAWVPYRVCPLGAHVDHQLGTSTAMALDRGVTLAYAPGPDGEVRLASREYPGVVRFSIDDVPARPVGDWGDLARGATIALQQEYHLGRGLVGLLSGRMQGGISSSAAVGVASLLALEDVNDLHLSATENIELDRRIENDYLGLRNGILDQAAAILSRRGHLTRIDCRTAAHETIPAPPGMPPFRILLAFSGLKAALVGTDYNRRVAECAEAARDLLRAAGRPGAAPVLGNLTADEYEAHKHRLRPEPARRAAHFFTETERVRLGVEAWRRGDLGRFGALMTASGDSSIRNYECGSPPLIHLHEILVETPGVFGARFSGAGFRGCCVALVDAQAVPQIAERVSAIYARRHPELAEHASVVSCGTADGAGVSPAPQERGRPSLAAASTLTSLP